MPGGPSVEIDKQLDWLLVRHDESEVVTQATEKAFQYLFALKQGIPTPAVSVRVAPCAIADEGSDEDQACDGSFGLTREEELFREREALRERARYGGESSTDDEGTTAEPKLARKRSEGHAAPRAVRAVGSHRHRRRPSRRRECTLRLRLTTPEGADASMVLRMAVPDDEPPKRAHSVAGAPSTSDAVPPTEPERQRNRGGWLGREAAMLQEAIEQSMREYDVAHGGSEAQHAPAAALAPAAAHAATTRGEGGEGGEGGAASAFSTPRESSTPSPKPAFDHEHSHGFPGDAQGARLVLMHMRSPTPPLIDDQPPSSTASAADPDDMSLGDVRGCLPPPALAAGAAQ